MERCSAPKVELKEGFHILKFATNGGMNLNYITISESSSTGINDLKNDILTAYPNPSSNGAFTFHLPESGKLVITDLSGKIVFNEVMDYSSSTVNLSGKSKGIYLATFTSTERQYRCKLIVK